MTLSQGLILFAMLGAAFPAVADDVNDQILSTLNATDTQSSDAASEPIIQQSVVIETDLWQRVRNGFAMPALDNEYVRRHETWYSSNPEYWHRMMVRSSKYLHFVTEEVEKRGYPSEIALLPMIESAYNPRAYSHAKASGMWQFIPSTGTHYGLEQTWWYDGRRDIFAATRAALDYLGMLHRMFGDWQLALAAYNWGEGSVSRAVARNRAKGLPTNYENLKMPAETRNYVPKLMAVRNLLAEPERFGLNLPTVENKPYFAVVNTTRHMDLDIAARLADMSIEEFLDLNPGYNQPVIAYKASRKLLVPMDRAALFTDRLANSQDGLLSWQAYQIARGDTVAKLADRYGTSAEQLVSINRLTGKRLAPGQLLLVPRINTQLASTPSTATPTLATVNSAITVAQALTLEPVTSAQGVSPDIQAPDVDSPDRLAALAAISGERPVTEPRANPDFRLIADARANAAGTKLQQAAAPVVPQQQTAAVTAASDIPMDEEEPKSAPKQASHHIVARGDTAFSLASRYGMSVQELLEINRLRDSRLVVGKRLSLVAQADTRRVSQRATAKIKRSKQYTVRSGDTAAKIARRFDVEIAELLRWNGLKRNSVLRPGDSMTIFIASN